MCTTENSRGDCIVGRLPGFTYGSSGSGSYPKQNGIKFVPAPMVERKLAAWDGLIPELEMRVKAAELVAVAMAPIESGRYMESITSEVGFDEKAKIIGRLKADDWKAIWIEYGTSKTPAHGTLRRSMEAIGLRVKLKRRGRG